MILKKLMMLMAVCCLLSSCLVFSKNKKSTLSKSVSSSLNKADTSKRTQGDTTVKNQLKKYQEVITSKAVSDSGLITIHKIDNRYYFQIPNSLLEKDLLLVTRISQAAPNMPGSKIVTYSGDQVGESIIQYSQGPGQKIFIKKRYFDEKSFDSSANGIATSLKRSSLQPIVASFDIKAYTPDSTAAVIDVTDFLNADNNLLYFDPGLKKTFQLGGKQADKSYVAGMQSYPINLELQVVNTYTKGDDLATYELNTSFVLLPEQPMKPRYADERVGYFAKSFIDYDAPTGVRLSSFINRWRLEPKEEDKEKYLSGELVEPKKPIVYYIDPATPKKWIPYLIQGVNDWQKAFEKAGFKNAIYALEAPTNDAEWSLYDARHNAIVYKPSVIANASGPHVHDPRTGEILETHINWYHNIQQVLRDWYFIQAGPNDCRAQKMDFDDKLMGELIRYVCAHEVGHTLGLMHNFGASSTMPTDSLRSKSYINKYGFSPSIMDYSRFNYVAQPEDNFTEKELMPRIGMYDVWAIEWGYRWLPQLKTHEDEKSFMNEWIIRQQKKDKRYWYGPQYFFFVTDPRNQSEDLGDNAMKAGNYGIQNLKRVMKNLIEWTKVPNEDFSGLNRMQFNVLNQYLNYVLHVAHNIGLFTWTSRRQGEEGTVVGYVPKEKQKEAVRFLQKQLFDTPDWLWDSKIFSLVGGYGAFTPSMIQQIVFNEVLLFDVYQRMEFVRLQYPKEAYTFDELLDDFDAGIWKELSVGNPIDFARMRLQKLYSEHLINMVNVQLTGNTFKDDVVYLKVRSTYVTTVKAHLRSILNKIDKSLALYKDQDTKRHLGLMKDRIKRTLDSGLPTGAVSISNTPQAFTDLNGDRTPLHSVSPEKNILPLKRMLNCWHVEKPLFDK